MGKAVVNGKLGKEKDMCCMVVRVSGSGVYPINTDILAGGELGFVTFMNYHTRMMAWEVLEDCTPIAVQSNSGGSVGYSLEYDSTENRYVMIGGGSDTFDFGIVRPKRAEEG